MANDEELNAMGIKVVKCKECFRDISEEEYTKYKGYCKNCYEKRKQEYTSKNRDVNEDFDGNGKNIVATVVKGIAIISAIVGLIVGLISIDELNSEIMAVSIIIISIISAVFLYALGEIIQKLENIEKNIIK